MTNRSSLIGVLAFAWALAMGCGSSRDIAGTLDADAGAGSSFITADASDDGEAGLIAYCPANKCPAGYTTCPSSRFACDANFNTDPNNCGACGVVCPGSALNGTFQCVNGACILKCDPTQFLDCNNSVDDGCETPVGTNDNCSKCGESCLCYKDLLTPPQCGCPSGRTQCGTDSVNCVTLTDDDNNCGACGTKCPNSGTCPTPPPNTETGCANGKCGTAKCTGTFGDCDKDGIGPDGKVNCASNGCETDLGADPKNCGACGNVCPAGQECRPDQYGRPFCACPAGQSYCDGLCVSFGSDPDNCGGCGISCAKGSEDHSIGQCVYGSCTSACLGGFGDCNGNPSDGCETSFSSDPRNCGGCGNACAPGQPCVGGTCALEPCPPGGATTR